MKRFIKITDISNNIHFLNVDYIIKFSPSSAGSRVNTRIYLTTNDDIYTSSTTDEIVDMINISCG